jgi:acylglycerol lipase
MLHGGRPATMTSVVRHLTLALVSIQGAAACASRPAATPPTPISCSAPCRLWETGTELQGYAWEAANARAALLLTHGYSEYAQRYVSSYNALIPRLLALGVTVYAIDLPGHGHSPGPRGAVNPSEASDLHLAIRRTLRAQPLPLFLFGHSLGGLVTVTSVLRDSAAVRGVILTSALLHRRDENAFTRFLAYFVGAVAPRSGVATADLSTISAIPEEVERARRDPMIYHGLVRAGVASSSLRLMRSNRKHYPRWQTPVLVLHGSEDKATDADGSRRFHTAIGARDKTLHIVEGGRHELLNDVRRDESLAIILQWIEQRLTTATPARTGRSP